MILKELLFTRKSNNLDTMVCFIDLKKAYDRIHHAALFHHLIQYDITGNILKTIMELYKGNVSVVRTIFGESPKFPYSNGVKQGCPLSPTLFNIFINSLA